MVTGSREVWGWGRRSAVSESPTVVKKGLRRAVILGPTFLVSSVPRRTVAMEPSSAPAGAFLSTVLGTFWTVFFASSVAGATNLLPGVSDTLRGFAKRGKADDGDDDGDVATDTTPKRKPRSRQSTVPHAWFTHFYVLGVLVNLVVLAHALQVAADLVTGGNTEGTVDGNPKTSISITNEIVSATRGALVTVLFQIHVTRRLLESFFVTKHRDGAQMHVVGYAVGLVYYVATPLTLAAPETLARMRAVLMNAIADGNAAAASAAYGQTVTSFGKTVWAFARTAVHGMYKITTSGVTYDSSQVQGLANAFLNLLNPRATFVLSGLLLFAIGNANQHACHARLASLRKDSVTSGGGSGSKVVESRGTDKSVPGSNPTTHYRIPRGGWFDLASSPHYFFEVVLYVGLFLCAGAGAVTRLAPMLAAICANLWVSAKQTHVWYGKNFPEYPKGRYVMVPGWA